MSCCLLQRFLPTGEDLSEIPEPSSHPLCNAVYWSPAVSTALIRALHPYDLQNAFITRVILISLKKNISNSSAQN